MALATALANDEFLESMERCRQAFDSLRERLPVIPYAYSRTRLIHRPHFEVILMHWSPGSVSPIHDHGRSRCWVLMLDGALEVHNFERQDDPGCSPVALRETGSTTLRCGDVDHRLTPRELHRVRNTSADPAYSLQLYAEPISEYVVVDAHTFQARVVNAATDLELPLL